MHPWIQHGFLGYQQGCRQDIVLKLDNKLDKHYLVWLEQPSNFKEDWLVHPIDPYTPDKLVGIKIADINGDGLMDIMTGGYSSGERGDEAKTTMNDELGRLAWFEHPEDLSQGWIRHDISRRKRGMYDQFVAVDLDKDGDIDFISTWGNSFPFDGVIWLEQVRTKFPVISFSPARENDSEEMPLPANQSEPK